MLGLYSLLMNLLEIVGVVLVVGAILFFGRVSFRRLGRGGSWTPYTRPIDGRNGTESLEVGVKRNRFLGMGAPDRMPLETITSRLVSDNPSNLYTLQSKAQETAASLNARSEQNDY